MPARFSKIMKALREHGIEIVKPNHGSHWKLVGPENTYFVTAHNGPKSEIVNAQPEPRESEPAG